MDFWLWVGVVLAGTGVTMFAIFWALNRYEHWQATKEHERLMQAQLDRERRSGERARERASARIGLNPRGPNGRRANN